MLTWRVFHGDQWLEMEALDEALSSLFPLCGHLFVSIVGGGGKTGLMQALGRFYKSLGRSVLLTTSTRIQSPVVYSWDVDRIANSAEEAENLSSERGLMVLYAESGVSPAKMYAPFTETLRALKSCYDVVLCEADGSRGKPLKIHSERDPVVPAFSDFTICVAGAWAAGKRIEDSCFAVGRLSFPASSDSGAAGSVGSGLADASFLQRLLDAPEGLLKRTTTGRRAVLLNGFETATLEQREVWRALRFPPDASVLCGSVRLNRLYERL